MAARATQPKVKRPTNDLGWERGHTSGIEDRRPSPLPPGWQGPPAPSMGMWGPISPGSKATQPGKPRQPGPVAHAPGYRRGKGSLPTGPRPGGPTGMPGLPPGTGAFRTPQATTGRGVVSQAAYKTPQATTGRGVKPLAAKPVVKIKKVAGSPKARAVKKNTGNVAGRRRL